MSSSQDRDPSIGIALDCYDAGLLSDYGGGDVGWWQDYIRSELARAHDFYQSQADALFPPENSASNSTGSIADEPAVTNGQ